MRGACTFPDNMDSDQQTAAEQNTTNTDVQNTLDNIKLNMAKMATMLETFCQMPTAGVPSQRQQSVTHNNSLHTTAEKNEFNA